MHYLLFVACRALFMCIACHAFIVCSLSCIAHCLFLIMHCSLFVANCEVLTGCHFIVPYLGFYHASKVWEKLGAVKLFDLT